MVESGRAVKRSSEKWQIGSSAEKEELYGSEGGGINAAVFRETGRGNEGGLEAKPLDGEVGTAGGGVAEGVPVAGAGHAVIENQDGDGILLDRSKQCGVERFERNGDRCEVRAGRDGGGLGDEAGGEDLASVGDGYGEQGASLGDGDAADGTVSATESFWWCVVPFADEFGGFWELEFDALRECLRGLAAASSADLIAKGAFG